MDQTVCDYRGSESGMGNDVSHTKGVRQSVGGGGKAGQFHTVLVESEYSIPDFSKIPDESPTSDVSHNPDESPTSDVSHNPDESPTSDIHDQATLKIRGVADDSLQSADDNGCTSPMLQPQPSTSRDDEYSLIEECKALITESADRAVHRSLSRTSKSEQITDLDAICAEDTIEEVSVNENATSLLVHSVESVTPSVSRDSTYNNIVVDDGVTPSEIRSEQVESKTAESVKRDHIDVNYALKCGVITGSTEHIFEANINGDKQRKKRKSKYSENVFHGEVIEPVKRKKQEHLDTEKQGSEKSSKGSFIAKMFKFSKRKPRSDKDVFECVKDKIKDEVTEENTVENNHITPKTFINGEFRNNDIVHENVAEVKRLNSLDSGIVIDKVNEPPTNSTVEYAVVQKKISKDLVKETDSTSLHIDTAEIAKIVNQSNELEHDESDVKELATSEVNEVIYINGEQIDEDFVYINERAIDVVGLVEPIMNTVSEKLPPPHDSPGNKVDVEEKPVVKDERKSNISTDSGTSSGSKVKRSDVFVKPEKANLKKKSWSFQVGSKKKQSNGIEPDSAVSMDPNASHTEGKKGKWRFGKFSFRRFSEAVSSSTPNLQIAGIPEEKDEVSLRQQKDDKKKEKPMKKLKKDKKRSHEKNGRSLDKRSTSLIDIIQGDSPAPRSRRSIVEDDLDYTQTDAFEGVTLSDLSQDEDTEVSRDPSGQPANGNKHDSIKDDVTQFNMENETRKLTSETKTRVAQFEKDKISNQSPLEIVPAIIQPEKKDEVKLTMSATATNNAVNKSMIVLKHTVTLSSSSLKADAIEDEYVNIVSANAHTLNNDMPQEHMENKPVDNEYAQVVKKNINQEEDFRNDDKSIVSVKVHNVDRASTENVETLVNDMKLPIEYTAKPADDEIIPVKEINKDDIIQESAAKSTEIAFSNLIYSDEEFQATLAKMVQTRCENEQDDDSDAYVQLQQLVEDFSESEVLDSSKQDSTSKKNTGRNNLIKADAIANMDTQTTEDELKIADAAVETIAKTECVSQECEIIKLAIAKMTEMCETTPKVCEVETPILVETTEKTETNSLEVKQITSAITIITEMSESTTKECEEIKPDMDETTEKLAETELHTCKTAKAVKFKGQVIVMKEVGVQAPDIYMPLDIDKDFGFTANNVPCVSIGVQVTDTDLEVEHVIVGIKIDNDTTTELVSSAYF